MGTGAALSIQLQSVPKQAGVITVVGTVGNVTRTIELAVNDANSIPKWLEPTLAGAIQLLFLGPNWDLEGGLPIDRASISAALQSLSELMDLGSSIPQWLPTSEGGVQLEWHEANVDLEIEFSAQGKNAHVVFGDLQDNHLDWEGPLAENIERLKSLFQARLRWNR
jgi:hypothetical protein